MNTAQPTNVSTLPHNYPQQRRFPGLLLLFMALTCAIYAAGLSGGWVFDDIHNIVQNKQVQPPNASLPNLVAAALSSPSSSFKRPLASLTFVANYLAGGLNPFGWKLVNLVIHLLNGWMVFLLARGLLRVTNTDASAAAASARDATLSALIAGAWMVLPINLGDVLYVVQRMESLANLFVLIGLIGYVTARRRMMAGNGGFGWCIASLIACTALGFTAKETAAMLPLYAFLIEWLVFGFRLPQREGDTSAPGHDRRLIVLYVFLLFLPLLAGLAWLLPRQLQPAAWAIRDFTLGTRLLSEARIVVDYIGWTLLPLPQWLSFYHDDFVVSQGLLQPWTTLAAILAIVALLVLAWRQRRRRPLFALGIALFFAGHLMTATILPLELIQDYRNYFASFGLLLAVLPLLASPGALALVRRATFALLALWWIALTAFTAWNWGDPLRFVSDLAARAPESPRAQYELGRTLILFSHYDPTSPFTARAYAPLERAAILPGSSILPEQALLILNARMSKPAKPEWWNSLIAKLEANSPGPESLAALASMTNCAKSGDCQFDESRMTAAFQAALSHPASPATLLATFGDYAWNVLGDHQLAMSLIERAVAAVPDAPGYRISLARMAAASGHPEIVHAQIDALRRLNYGGRLDRDITDLQTLE